MVTVAHAGGNIMTTLRPVYLPKTKPRQTKRSSAAESLANAICGLGISWAFTFWGLPIFGIEPDPVQATWITASYFFLSAVRSYALRRLFN
jgi:hypothetical protein